jgi:hypothetical protein
MAATVAGDVPRTPVSLDTFPIPCLNDELHWRSEMSFVSLLFSVITAMAATPAGNPNTEYREYDFNALEKIRVTNTSGKITVNPMPAQKVIIAITKKKFSERCTADITRPSIDLVLVEVNKPLGEVCEADIDLQVPKDVALDITSGSGGVAITGNDGALHFSLGSGSLIAKGDFKSIDGKSGSGDVKIEGLTHGGNINVGSGRVELSFLDNPQGQFDVKTGSGAATLKFPKDSKINAALEAGSGATTSEFENNPSGYGVSVKSGSGDLTVKSY